MRMFCPNCRAVVEPVGDSKPESYTCPACGSTFVFDVALTLAAESEDTVAASLTPHVSLLVQCQTIGRFQIQSEVGRGGFGTVFKAYDSELRRTVAVKVPRHGGLVTDHEPRAIPAQGAQCFAAASPGDRADLRPGGVERTVVHRQRVRRRSDPRGALAAAQILVRRVGRAHRRRGRRPAMCARQGSHSPRHQAVEHHRRHQWRTAVDGFRHGAAGRRPTLL